MYTQEQVINYLNISRFDFKILENKHFARNEDRLYSEEEILGLMNKYFHASLVEPLPHIINVNEPLLTPKQVSSRINLSFKTLDNNRYLAKINPLKFSGFEIPYYKFSNKGVRYSVAEVNRWLSYRQSSDFKLNIPSAPNSKWHNLISKRNNNTCEVISMAETNSLKTIASKVLQRNKPRNKSVPEIKDGQFSTLNKPAAIPADLAGSPRSNPASAITISLDLVKVDGQSIKGHTLTHAVKDKKEAQQYIHNMQEVIQEPWYISRYTLDVDGIKHRFVAYSQLEDWLRNDINEKNH